MVQRIYVKCPTCGKLYQIKIQLDQNIRIFDWPICFGCIDCGESLDYTYDKNGLHPQTCSFQPNLSDWPITTIGYSSSLPITNEIYMKDLDYSESKVLFSPYINLTHKGCFLSEELDQFNLFLSRMQVNLLPYKGMLRSLLPILLKGNVNAFSKKMANLLGETKYQPLSSPREMYDTYFELIETAYYNLITPYYKEHYHNRFVKPIDDYLNGATSVNVMRIKEKLDESGKISIWYKKEALPYIAEIVNNIQTLLPAMLLSNVDRRDVMTRCYLKIVTISCKNATGIYSKGFETYTHALKIVVGLNNIIENGDIDVFTNPNVGDVDTITKFANKSGGTMLKHIENYTSIYDYLDGTMNNRVRNASSHGDSGIDYDPLTQTVKCYFDDSDRDKHYDTTLIEICRMSYVQLLHIMEVTLLAWKIVKKAK